MSTARAPRLEPRQRKTATWGDIYYLHLDRGEDHGLAAFAADEWEQRMMREKRRREIETAARRLIAKGWI